jgi:hypothetical protein
MKHFEERSDAMRQLSITPSITVTIGPHTRLYLAFVTSAPATLDSPGTITLHESTYSDILGFADEPISVDVDAGKRPGRLILIDALEFAWQQAKYHGEHYSILPADRILVGSNTLQHWLWERIQGRTSTQVAA